MLRKANLAGPGGSVEFQFNPETIGFGRTVEFKDDSTAGRQYIKTDNIELSLKMQLDDMTNPLGSIATSVAKLLSWTTGKKKSPPKALIFSWGVLQVGTGSPNFECHLKSLKISYTLFTPAGKPVQATVDVTLLGIPPKEPGLNPTSGGMTPIRRRTVRSGDHLPVLAHDEYGATSTWRTIADRNAVDNPFRPRPGAEMLFPTRLEMGGRRGGK